MCVCVRACVHACVRVCVYEKKMWSGVSVSVCVCLSICRRCMDNDAFHAYISNIQSSEFKSANPISVINRAGLLLPSFSDSTSL